METMGRDDDYVEDDYVEDEYVEDDYVTPLVFVFFVLLVLYEDDGEIAMTDTSRRAQLPRSVVYRDYYDSSGERRNFLTSMSNLPPLHGGPLVSGVVAAPDTFSGSGSQPSWQPAASSSGSSYSTPPQAAFSSSSNWRLGQLFIPSNNDPVGNPVSGRSVSVNQVGVRVGGGEPIGQHQSRSRERSRRRTPGFDPVVQRRMDTPPPARTLSRPGSPYSGTLRGSGSSLRWGEGPRPPEEAEG